MILWSRKNVFIHFVILFWNIWINKVMLTLYVVYSSYHKSSFTYYHAYTLLRRRKKLTNTKQDITLTSRSIRYSGKCFYIVGAVSCLVCICIACSCTYTTSDMWPVTRRPTQKPVFIPYMRYRTSSNRNTEGIFCDSNYFFLLSLPYLQNFDNS